MLTDVEKVQFFLLYYFCIKQTITGDDATLAAWMMGTADKLFETGYETHNKHNCAYWMKHY